MMKTLFIASRLRYKKRIITISIAISYIVMIVAMAVSSGFRTEVRNALSQMGGDIQLAPVELNLLDDVRPMDANPSYLPLLQKVQGVESVNPAIYRAGIVKVGDNIHGVVVKGEERSDSTTLSVSIPRRLSEIGGLQVGDKMLTYFVGEKVRARSFTVESIYDPIIETDDKLVVYADIKDMQRLNGWNGNQVSMLEIRMKPEFRDEFQIEAAAYEIGLIAETRASSTPSRYPQLFDWLNLLDFNVLFVLVLMMIVAGVNMISGLLITLFENISTIGVFKAMGMKNKEISKVFLASSSVAVLKGMILGNAIACLLCIIQDKSHFLKLDPKNYFVSFVPVDLDFMSVFTLDVVSFVVIMLLLMIPCAFISTIDPAETVKVN